MNKKQKRRGRIATSYHENQFASSFDPLSRRGSLTDLPQEHLSRHPDSRSPTRTHHGKSSSRTMAVNYKSSSLFSDKESRIILKDLEGKHKEPMKAKKLIYEQGEKMKRLTKEKLILAEECLTYQTLLEELFFDDETLIINRGLHYTYLEFKDEKLETFLKPTMSEGRAFLSNSRLLLVTCEQLKGTTLSRTSSPIQGDGYEVAAYLNEEYHYQFLPLTCIKGIEIHTRNGGQAEVQIRRNPPSGRSGGICSWLGSLFWGSCIKESWETISGPSGAEYTEQILLLSVTMPPWMTPMNIKIHVNPDVKLKAFIHFVSLIQKFAPDIVSSLNMIGEVDTEKVPVGADDEYSELPSDKAPPGGLQQPAINVDKIKQHQMKRPVKAPKFIPQPQVGFTYGLLPPANMVNPVYYDPRCQRVYGDFVEYDLRSIHHEIQRLPQVQLNAVQNPPPCPNPCLITTSKIASQLEEEKVEDLIRKRSTMVGRQLPEPTTENAFLENETEDVTDYDKPDVKENLPSIASEKGYDPDDTETTLSADEASSQIHYAAIKPVKGSQASDIAQGRNIVQVVTVEEESDEGEMMTVSLKAGRSGGYIISTVGSSKDEEIDLESTDKDSNVETKVVQRKYRSPLAEEEENCGTEPAVSREQVARNKMVNSADGNIRCVCPRCLNESVEGAHWTPLTRRGEPELCDADKNMSLKINKSGYCTCAKCLESTAQDPK